MFWNVTEAGMTVALIVTDFVVPLSKNEAESPL